MSDQLIGSIGVGLLLIAFLLNLAERLATDSPAYQALNFLGATIACWASWRISFYPFLVLEGTWALVALAALLRGRWARGSTRA